MKRDEETLAVNVAETDASTLPAPTTSNRPPEATVHAEAFIFILADLLALRCGPSRGLGHEHRRESFKTTLVVSYTPVFRCFDGRDALATSTSAMISGGR